MLKEKTAIITGGARGIGAAIAKKMAQNGANIAILDYGNEDLGNAVVAEVMEKYGVKAAFYKCDVTNFEKCKEVVSQVSEELGKPDILVNNAGITRDNLMLTMSEEEFDSVIGTNLKGTYNMTKACSRGFLRQKKRQNYQPLFNLRFDRACRSGKLFGVQSRSYWSHKGRG